jgi:hypothetical protein
MKNVLISAAAASMLALAAVPAAAQPWGGYDDHDRYEGRYSHHRDIAQGDELRARIDRAERSGRIDYRSANRLRNELRSAENYQYLARRDGRVTSYERISLERRLDAVAGNLQRLLERNDRAEGYGHDWRR